MGVLSPSTIISSGIVRTLPIVGVHKALIWTLRISHLYHKSIHHTTCKREHNRSAMQKYKGNIINCIFMKHLLNSSNPHIHLKIQEIWWHTPSPPGIGSSLKLSTILVVLHQRPSFGWWWGRYKAGTEIIKHTSLDFNGFQWISMYVFSQMT
jgi:hypothetical protein